MTSLARRWISPSLECRLQLPLQLCLSVYSVLMMSACTCTLVAPRRGPVISFS